MRFLLLLAFAPLAAAQSNSDVILRQSFDQDTHGWSAFGPGASVALKHDSGHDALAFTYEIKPGQIAAAVLPATPAFGRMRRLRFRARTDYDTSLGVMLTERTPGGGRYGAWFWSPANTWQLIELTPSDFALSDGPQDPPDPDGKLDLDSLAAVGIVDLGQLFGSMPANPEVPIVVNRPSGRHAILVSDFEVLAGPAPSRSTMIDSFDRGFLQWVTPGGMRLRRVTENPLHMPALEASYEQMEGQLQVLVRPLAHLDLSRARRISFDIASLHESTLIVSLELKKPGGSNGPRYNMTIYPPGGREVFHVDLDLAEFDGPGKLDPSQLKTLAITDITASSGGVPQSNSIWIGKVEAPE